MSKLNALRQAEQERERLEKQIEKMRSEVKNLAEFVDEVTEMAKERKLNLYEVAVALVPSLDPNAGSKGGAPKTRRTRTTKQYKNPETGETIETKGGNHKMLKEWKKKYGADVVEGWKSVA